MKPSALIRAYGVENVFDLLSSHDQDLMRDNLVKILKHRGLDEADQLGPKPKQRTMTVLKFTGMGWGGLDSLKLTSRCFRILTGTRKEQ